MKKHNRIFRSKIDRLNHFFTERNKLYPDRLYRIRQTGYIGGVASGLGAYFKLDPIIVRILLIALFFLVPTSTFVLYIILWICIPKYKGKLNENYNYDNFIRNPGKIKDVFKSGRFYFEFPEFSRAKKKPKERPATVVEKVANTKTGPGFSYKLAKFLKRSFGAVLLAIGMLFFGTSISNLGGSIQNGLGYADFFVESGELFYWIGIYILSSIPIIFILFTGILCFFSPKGRGKLLIVPGILVLLLIGSAFIGISSAMGPESTQVSMAFSDVLNRFIH